MVDPTNNTPPTAPTVIQPNTAGINNDNLAPSDSQAPDWFLPKALSSLNPISATQDPSLGNIGPALLAERVLTHLGA